MSLMFDRASSEACAASHASSLAPPDLPVSVTCWVYVEAQPGQSETHTVWWFGRDGIDSQFLKLVFQADGQSDIKFQATFKASNNAAVATATGYATGAWHCISVVVEEMTGPSQYRVRLYVDDAAVEEGTTSASGAAVNDYDIFALGRMSGATKSDYASCRVEQVAAWQGEPVLGESDNEEMFSGRIPPRDAKESPISIGREPDLAYWILAGHGRSALRINSSQESQLHQQRGELFNELGSTFPTQQIQPNVAPPRWSAKTPIFRWKDKGKDQAIEDRPPKTARSRLQARFVFFLEPRTVSSPRWGKPGSPPSPIWDHPNFEHLGQSQFHNAGAERHLPSAANEPRSDLAVVAAAMADWLAFQGFAAGTGSEGGGQYEGSLYLRGIGRGETTASPDEEGELNLFGWDTPNDPSNPFGIEGAYTHIPLLQHPFDHIDEPTSGPVVKDIWNVWYNDHGVALCREWSEHFWQALKEELDERGLCYPARLHWDYEHQPNENSAMSAGAGTAADPIGNWGAMLDDPRVDDDDHPVYIEPAPSGQEWTLEAVYNTRPADLDPADSPWNDNIEVTNWLGGWMIAMRNSALYRGVIAPVATHFEHTRWSNYFDFVADHPDYTYPRRGPSTGSVAYSFNTPAGIPGIHADFSTPILFQVLRRDLFMKADAVYNYGATPSSVYRGTIRMAIDCCVNSHTKLPVAPWLGSPVHVCSEFDPPYISTFEDIFDGFAYAWKRGVDEFLVFNFGGSTENPNDSWDQAWYVCNRLLDWVHMLPQSAQGERVARSNRLGRRQ